MPGCGLVGKAPPKMFKYKAKASNSSTKHETRQVKCEWAPRQLPKYLGDRLYFHTGKNAQTLHVQPERHIERYAQMLSLSGRVRVKIRIPNELPYGYIKIDVANNGFPPSTIQTLERHFQKNK